MSHVALGNPDNYTIGGLRFYFSEDISGSTPVAIVAADNTPGSSTVSLAGDLTATYGVGSRFTITGDSDNNGTYDVASSSFDATNTVVVLVQDLSGTTGDGDVTLTRGSELYLGNVVTGSYTSDLSFLDHFTAKAGTRSKDRSIVQEISVSINLTLDEPNVDNMNLFMLGGTVTDVAGSPASKRFAPYTKTERSGGARLAGVSDTGNEWVWTVLTCSVKPDGDFSFDDQDWSQFNFIVDVLSDSTNPTTPFGFVDHYGVGENIDVTLPLGDNS